MIATIAIVAAGVERGIEHACTLLLPIFILLLVGSRLHRSDFDAETDNAGQHHGEGNGQLA
jgi:hypothetical protein